MEGYSENSDHESYEPTLVRGLADVAPILCGLHPHTPPYLSSDEEAGDPDLHYYLDDLSDLRTTLPD